MFPNTQIKAKVWGFRQGSDSSCPITQTSKAAFSHVFSLRSPCGPGDDIQLASPLDPSEEPFAVSTADGDVGPTDVAELTEARYCMKPLQGTLGNSCKLLTGVGW